MSSRLGVLLVVLHGGLLAWAVPGFVEWFAGDVPWPSLANPLFPDWLQLLHWLVVLSAAVLFLWGYATRWPATPRAMIPAYALMAAVCAIETFGYLTHPLRFVAMALEFAAYVAIPVMLNRAPSLAARFEPQRRRP